VLQIHKEEQMQALPGQKSSLMDRLVGVITLKAPVYREIADDNTATTQAAVIVVVAALIAGFFSGLVTLDSTGAVRATVGGAIVSSILRVIFALIGWAFAAWVLAFVARSFFQGRTTTFEMLRVTGFVQVFTLVSVVSVLALVTPVLGCLVGLIGFVVAIFQIIGYVIGVREAAEFSTTNAIITAIIAAIVQFVIVIIIGGAIATAIIAGLALTGGL
jgi:hypothetical protein